MKTQFNSVWDALEDDPVKQENMKLRSQLMMEINSRLEKESLTQVEIAELLDTTQPRVSALKHGKINEFRLDMLIDFATRLGLRITLNIAA